MRLIIRSQKWYPDRKYTIISEKLMQMQKCCILTDFDKFWPWMTLNMTLRFLISIEIVASAFRHITHHKHRASKQCSARKVQFRWKISQKSTFLRKIKMATPKISFKILKENQWAIGTKRHKIKPGEHGFSKNAKLWARLRSVYWKSCATAVLNGSHTNVHNTNIKHCS